ncbi:MarR family winged helix-turn-helix transcriptional regulator [Aliidiomarina maris]|uniref:MarR family transcriptional regulator n=1 Tax=Aliidiomarina maris TaxID=531312 RepID=A0A327X6R1_9GAMM|nr:MarR family transcriptional regulator [Aliidiomarina maris]RAK01878.1 DNA-binding MarR family transcriptional regulator [Aliidiomarina maris]RUO28684.1 MarR family transcriptional regulator [Aliidiomarina maris]
MKNYSHQQSLGHLTGLASRLFNRLLTIRFKQAGIDMTAEQWGVILILRNSEPMTQSQISELLYLEKSSVSRSIDGLEKRGWVERQSSTHDSRSKIVMLTEKSLGVVAECEEIAASVLQDAQQDIDDQELQTSKQHLSKVITSLRQLNR